MLVPHLSHGNPAVAESGLVISPVSVRPRRLRPTMATSGGRGKGKRGGERLQGAGSRDQVRQVVRNKADLPRGAGPEGAGAPAAFWPSELWILNLSRVSCLVPRVWVGSRRGGHLGLFRGFGGLHEITTRL